MTSTAEVRAVSTAISQFRMQIRRQSKSELAISDFTARRRSTHLIHLRIAAARSATPVWLGLAPEARTRNSNQACCSVVLARKWSSVDRPDRKRRGRLRQSAKTTRKISRWRAPKAIAAASDVQIQHLSARRKQRRDSLESAIAAPVQAAKVTHSLILAQRVLEVESAAMCLRGKIHPFHVRERSLRVKQNVDRLYKTTSRIWRCRSKASVNI